MADPMILAAVESSLDHEEMEAQAAEEAYDHLENLASTLSDEERSRLGSEIAQWVEDDIKSREGHVKLFADGLRIFGTPNEESAEKLYEGASTVILPVLSEAVVQFHARAAQELFPPGGPVKATIQGETTEERLAQGDRVQEGMNYHLTETLPYYYDESESLLVYCCLQGSAFRKVYNDHNGVTQSELVDCSNVILPYFAGDVLSSPRITHRIFKTKNEFRRDVRNGKYEDVTLGDPPDVEPDAAQEQKDKLQGEEPTGAQQDGRHTFYEVHLEYDLPGHEEDIALPWIITIDKETQKVLSIRRNWEEGDKDYQRDAYFVHYKYFPGLGVYGLGLLHLIGGLSQAATDALRAMLDAASFQNMPGGVKKKGARIEGKDIEIGPGDWIDLDGDFDDIRKAFMPLPYHGPSEAMFKLLGYLQESAQRLSSTMEVMVGDASSNAPVGTTVALIEQGSKVYSGIHARLHRAQKQEFRLIAKRMHQGGYVYPFAVEGGLPPEIAQEDFDGRVDIIPVSDPKIFSQTQRIAQAQSSLEVAGQFPQDHNMHEVLKRFHQAVGTEEVDEILPDPSDIEPLDPVSENMAVLMQKPITVYAWEDHQAHMMVHEQFLMQHAQNPMLAEVIGPALQAHMAEHVAYLYQMQIMQQIGQPLPTPDLKSGKGSAEKPQLPPQMLNYIAMQSAQAAQRLAQQMPPTPEQRQQMAEQQMAEAEVQRKAQETQAEQQRKDAMAQADQQRKQAEAAAEQRRKDMIAAADVERKTKESNATIRRQDLVTAADVERKTKESQTGIQVQRTKAASDMRLADQESDARVEVMEDKADADIKRQAEQAKAQQKLAAKKPRPKETE